MMKNLLINILYYIKIAGKQKKLYWIKIYRKEDLFSIKYFSHQQDRRMFEEARYRI